jgi:hypothetical protein
MKFNIKFLLAAGILISSFSATAAYADDNVVAQENQSLQSQIQSGNYDQAMQSIDSHNAQRVDLQAAQVPARGNIVGNLVKGVLNTAVNTVSTVGTLGTVQYGNGYYPYQTWGGSYPVYTNYSYNTYYPYYSVPVVPVVRPVYTTGFGIRTGFSF